VVVVCRPRTGKLMLPENSGHDLNIGSRSIQP
jgi:hypothetical protein